MKYICNSKKKGFTLLEILLVVAAIAILAAIVIVAINPNRQLAKLRDAERQSEVTSIYKALQQYTIDNNGNFPNAIENMSSDSSAEICRENKSCGSSYIDLTSELTPTYISSIPEDPQVGSDVGTGYIVVKDKDGYLIVKAENAELQDSIIAGGANYDQSDEGGNANQTEPLLDSQGGAEVAYSVRKLDSNYNGSAVTIRKEGGGTSDIGFAQDGTLDTTEISNFCGSSNCYVQTWHDQSGNDRDVTQSTNTNQPLIYDGGSMVTDSGKPSLKFDGNDDELTISSASWLANTKYSTFAVTNYKGSESTPRYFAGNLSKGTPSVHWGRREASSTVTIAHFADDYNYTFSIGDNTHLHAFNFFDDGSEYHINDVKLGASNNTPSSTLNSENFTVGNALINSGNDHWKGTLSELIIYASDQSSNRESIESNINSFYNIY